jgi:serine/threonine-protein kinase
LPLGPQAAAEPRGTPAAAAPAAPAAPAKTRAPRFEQKEEIGRGRLGVVVRAEDVNDGRSVALRILPPQVLAAEGALQALVADLRAAAQVSHPSVVKVLGLVELGGQKCVVSELVAGRNFAEALATGRRLSFQQVHGLGRVVAQALVAIHGRSLVHGSVQPSNIIVAQGVIKLADLGLGRLLPSTSSPSDYRPPEGGLDVHADLYGLAAVLYHLLTGTHPKAQPQGVGLPLPSSLAPGVPEALDKLLLRSLHPRRELRFESAEDMLRELREMVRIG